MKRYDHMFTIAFSVKTDATRVEDITHAEFEWALKARVQDIQREDNWPEAVGAPDDTVDLYSELPIEDWRKQVASEETTLGYHEWMEERMKQ